MSGRSTASTLADLLIRMLDVRIGLSDRRRAELLPRLGPAGLAAFERSQTVAFGMLVGLAILMAGIAPPAPWAGVLAIAGLLTMAASAFVLSRLQRRAIGEACAFHGLPAEAGRGLRGRRAFEPSSFDAWLAQWSSSGNPDKAVVVADERAPSHDSLRPTALGWAASIVVLFAVVVGQHARGSVLPWQDVLGAVSVLSCGFLMVRFSRRGWHAVASPWSRKGEGWILLAASVPVWIALAAH